MLRYQPKFRHLDKAARPPNLAEAEHVAPGVTPVYPGPDELLVDVETPAGDVLAIDSPALRERLRAASGVAQDMPNMESMAALARFGRRLMAAASSYPKRLSHARSPAPKPDRGTGRSMSPA